MLLQSIYLKIANGIYNSITSKIPEKLRNVLIVLSFFCMVSTAFLGNYGNEETWPHLKTSRVWFFAAALIIVVVMSIDREVKKLNWNILVYATFMLTGLLLVVNRLDHDSGEFYFSLGVLMLTGFMWLAFVWGNRGDYDELFRLVSLGVLIMDIFLIAICFKNYPYCYDPAKDYHEAGNYWFWHVSNPNGVTKTFMAMNVAMLYLAKTSKKTVMRAVYSVILGMNLYITYITHSRNSVLAFVVFGVIMIIHLALRVKRGEKAGGILKNLCLVAVCIAVGAGISYYALVVMQQDKIDAIPYKEVVEEEDPDYSEYLDHEYDIYSEEYMYQRQAMLARDYPTLDKLDEKIFNNRVWITWMYFDNLNLTGHTKKLAFPPHNQFMLLAWFTGIFTGIFWFIFCVVVGIKLLIYYLKGYEWAWFAFAAFLAYIIQAMLEQGLFPMDKPFILLFYLAAMPCFIKAAKLDSKENI